MKKLSKQSNNVAIATSLPSKFPYIYPYKLPDGTIKYRVRIRKKMFGGKPLVEHINEIYSSLEQAKKRLYDLEFGSVLEERELYRKIISEGSSITITELFNEYYKKRLSNKENKRDYTSRINIICNTVIESEDTRVTKVANFTFTKNNLINSDEVKFGDFRVNNVDLNVINRFVDSRLKKVKPQTCINDIIVINNVLKDCHNLFTQLKQIEEPLAGFNWNQLKPQVVYRDKRLRPAHRQIIEELLITKSRNIHYHHFFLFLYHTGARISEVLSIQIKDIDFDRRTIFMITKKNKQPRYIGMNESLFPVIKERAEGKKPTDFLFPYKKDTYESKLTLLRPFLLSQGIKFTWHDLRHNYISSHLNSKNVLQIMHEMDINDMQYFQQQYLNVINSEKTAMKVAQAQQLTPQEVQGMVGHMRIEQTQEYTHHSPDFLEPKLDLMTILKQQQEQLKLQQEQIAELLALSKK